VPFNLLLLFKPKFLSCNYRLRCFPVCKSFNIFVFQFFSVAVFLSVRLLPNVTVFVLPIFTSAKEIMLYPLSRCPSVCLFLCLSVCLLAISRKYHSSDLHENFTRDVPLDKEEVKGWGSGPLNPPLGFALASNCFCLSCRNFLCNSSLYLYGSDNLASHFIRTRENVLSVIYACRFLLVCV